MAGKHSRSEFLRRVSCRPAGTGAPLRFVPVDSEFAHDHFAAACSALSLRLILVEDDELGYVFRLTPAGMYLLDGHLEAAAAALRLARHAARLYLPPHHGLFGTRLRRDGPGLSLHAILQRETAVQVMLAVATGHALVSGERVLANPYPPRPPAAAPQAQEPQRVAVRPVERTAVSLIKEARVPSRRGRSEYERKVLGRPLRS